MSSKQYKMMPVLLNEYLSYLLRHGFNLCDVREIPSLATKSSQGYNLYKAMHSWAVSSGNKKHRGIPDGAPSSNTIMPLMKSIFGDGKLSTNCLIKLGYKLTTSYSQELCDFENSEDSNYLVGTAIELSNEEFKTNLTKIINYITVKKKENESSKYACFNNPQELFHLYCNVSKTSYKEFMDLKFSEIDEKDQKETALKDFELTMIRDLIANCYLVYHNMIVAAANNRDPTILRLVIPSIADQIAKDKIEAEKKITQEKDQFSKDSMKQSRGLITKDKESGDENNDENDEDEGVINRKKGKKRKIFPEVGNPNKKTVTEDSFNIGDYLNQENLRDEISENKKQEDALYSLLRTESSYINTSSYEDIESTMNEMGIHDINDIKSLILNERGKKNYDDLVEIMLKNLKEMRHDEFNDFIIKLKSAEKSSKTPAPSSKQSRNVTNEKEKTKA